MGKEDPAQRVLINPSVRFIDWTADWVIEWLNGATHDLMIELLTD